MQQIRVCTYDGPGAQPVIRNVPWPAIPKKAALIKVGACGVCGTDLHILKGRRAEAVAVAVHARPRDRRRAGRGRLAIHRGFHEQAAEGGIESMIDPPLMPCGHCYYCIHYPESANKCLTPFYYGRYLGFDKAPHLWAARAEYVYVDLEMLPGTRSTNCPTTCRCGWARCRNP